MKKVTPFLPLLALLIAGCSDPNSAPEASTERSLRIYTSIAPLHYACEQLLGDMDQVLPICPVGEDEPEYIPERDVLTDMVQSDLIVVNGATFENWLTSVSIPETKVHDSAKIYEEEWVKYDGVVHAHGDKEEHSHSGYNGHTWLSPYHFQKQCTSVYEKLKAMLSPEEQELRQLDQRYSELMEELSGLHAHAQSVFEPAKGATLAATHPTYDYIGKAYGFQVFNIDLPPDLGEIDESAQAQLDALKQQIDENGVTFLFWEEEPSRFIAEVVTELGVRNLVFDPLAGMDDPDYITGMMDNLDRAAEIMAGNRP